MAVFPGATYLQNTQAVSPRRVKPFILAAVHITANAGLPGPIAEANYANRVGSGASFHFCVGRDGFTVQCANPLTQVAWTNGSWSNPNYRLSTVIRAITQLYGANDSTFLTIENVGAEPYHPVNATQIEKCAHILAWGSRLSGIVPSRDTVLGHRDYDSVSRMHCPTAGNLELLLGRIIVRTQQLLAPKTATRIYRPAPGGLPVGRFRIRTGDTVVIRAGKPLRDRPSWSQGNVYATLARDQRVELWGVQAGEQVPGAPNADWYFCGMTIQGLGERVVHVPAYDTRSYQRG